MTKKLILQKRVSATSDSGIKPIFINADLLGKIRDIKAETGIPMKQIVEQFLTYSIANVEIVEPEEEVPW